MKYSKIKPKLPILENYTILEQIFAARGLTPVECEKYLSGCTLNLDPLNLDNMRDGAQLLAQHLASNNKIFVIVDPDVDGFTSAAVLLNYLHYYFPFSVENNFEYGLHNGKEHGLNDFVNHILNSDYKLVILPDAGSNDYEAHRLLKEHAIDTLIIDHHESDKYSENAIIINNQLSKD